MSDVRADLRAELESIRAEGRWRTRPEIDSRPGPNVVRRVDGRRVRVVNWASNDYLGASQALKVRNGALIAVRRYGAGSGAARLLAGGLRCHHRLEQRLAQWLGAEACVVTTTGFQANLAALVALAGEVETAVILDRLAHASIYDGTRLSNGQLLRFRHNDPEDLARQLAKTGSARRRIVVVESVYSMDGDEAPLAAIHALCRTHDALLIVDEAHALGVLGPDGRGLCAEHGITPDLRVGTCSKALGAQGGFVVGDRDLIDLIVNRGRAFIFSTAPVPAASGAAVAALDWMGNHPAAQTHLLELSRFLRDELQSQGWQVPAGRTPIIPLIIGDEARTVALAQQALERGHWAPAIRPPTVPPGQCRLRISVTAAHTKRDARRLVEVLTSLRAS